MTVCNDNDIDLHNKEEYLQLNNKEKFKSCNGQNEIVINHFEFSERVK